MTSDYEASRSSTTAGLPVAPALGPALDELRVPRQAPDEGPRVLRLTALAMLVAAAAAAAAELLVALIYGITNLAFYGRLAFTAASPAGNHLGAGVILVPVLGGLIVGVMARFGSPAIRGHGIPEAMERILLNESRIAPRLTLLKPISSAVAIGTGGPFGAEGPIIATGGALGSLLGLKRAAVVIFADNTLRDAADHMVHERVGRLPVVTRKAPRTVVEIISRSDLLDAHEPRLEARWNAQRTFDVRRGWSTPAEGGVSSGSAGQNP